MKVPLIGSITTNLEQDFRDASAGNDFNLDEDGWKWEAFDVGDWVAPRKNALAAGECENYQTCLVNMVLCGVLEVKGNNRTFFQYGNRQVFIRFTRLSDGWQMRKWGNDSQGIIERLR